MSSLARRIQLKMKGHKRSKAPRNTASQPFRRVEVGLHFTKKRYHRRRNGKMVYNTSPQLTQEEMLNMLTGGKFGAHHLNTVKRTI